MKSVILFTLSFILTSQILGGERDTHGGGYFSCPESKNGKTYNLLDLWEGQVFEGLYYNHYEGNFREQLKKILSKFDRELSSAFSQKIRKYVERMVINKRFILEEDEIEVLPPRDTQSSLGKKGCELRGVASFQSAPHSFGFLYIDQKSFESLSEFEKAALFIHEAIYKILRDEVGVRDSMLARRITANIISLNGHRYFSKETLICSDIFGENSFYVTETFDSLSRVYLVNGYDQSVHPDTSILKEMNLENFIQAMPELEFPLTGRPDGAKIQFIYKDSELFEGYEIQTNKKFEPVLCKLRQ